MVTRASGVGNSRIRRITRNGKDKLLAIRTSQDRWLACPRARDDSKLSTLSDVDAVAVASLDPDDPAYARIHLFDASDLEGRFDRAYVARRAAGHSIPRGRGVWIALYENEAPDPPSFVGRGRPRDEADRPRAVGQGRRGEPCGRWAAG